MKKLEKRITRIKDQLIDPRHRTPSAHLDRQARARSIVDELAAFPPSRERRMLQIEAKRLLWANPLPAYEGKIETLKVVHIPARMLKRNHFDGETRFYFPAHFGIFEEDGLKISCSLIKKSHENDLHYHNRFKENMNVADGSIFLSAFGPKVTNSSSLETGNFAIIPEKVAHNFKAECDSIVFTEKSGVDSVIKMQGISEVNPPKEGLSRKFDKLGEKTVDVYYRFSITDHLHSIGFVMPRSDKAAEYCIDAQVFYFCVQGSMLVAMKTRSGWTERTAEEGSMTVFNRDANVRLAFTEDARLIFIKKIDI